MSKQQKFGLNFSFESIGQAFRFFISTIDSTIKKVIIFTLLYNS